MDGVDQSVSCQVCGRAPTDDADRFSWVMDRRDGRVSWTCPHCATENIRSLEAKLDPEWW